MMPRKREPTSEEILRRMYPDIMTSDDYVEEDDKARQAQDKSNPEIAELKAQLAALQGQLDTQRRTNTALTTRQGPDVPPQPPKVDMSKAPNPVDDPEGYANFISTAINAQVQYEKEVFYHQQQQQQSAQSRTDNLWNDFSEKYPDYAKQDRRVAIAAREVVARAQAKRLDIDKYMYDNSDTFMQDVVKEMDALWDKQASSTVVDDDGDDDSDEGRTDGLFGGGQQSQGGAAKVKEQAPKYGQLSTEVLAWQKKMGLRH